MSIWTHVAGVIRIDDFRLSRETPDFDILIGKECLWDNEHSVWEDQEANPDKYLPMGSEGSLEKSIWINPDRDQLAAYTVTVFGDLRDYDKVDEIKNWFESVCNRLGVCVRNAVITIECEIGDTIVCRYNQDSKKLDVLEVFKE